MQREREKKKTIHNERAKYEVVAFVFSKSLPYFTVYSFLQSRVSLCPGAEILHPFSNEVVHPRPPPLGKFSFS